MSERLRRLPNTSAQPRWIDSPRPPFASLTNVWRIVGSLAPIPNYLKRNGKALASTPVSANPATQHMPVDPAPISWEHTYKSSICWFAQKPVGTHHVEGLFTARNAGLFSACCESREQLSHY